MDGISDKLNKEIAEEVKLEDLKKEYRLMIENRKPVTRARIQELKDQRQIYKDINGTMQLCRLSGISYHDVFKMLNDDSSVKLARVVKVLDCLDIKIKFVINGA